MTRNRIKQALAALALVGLAAPAAAQGLSPAEVARLGNDLTPLGAIRAGNEAGTIPEWTGGIRSAAEAGFPDFQSGGHHPDPFADDKPLFRITAANMDEYADILTEGHKAMFRAYPEYFMEVYPTRRSAAVPERIYDATKRIAPNMRLIEGGNGFSGGAEGIPFPVPQNGLEAIWNHIVRYRTDSARRTIGQAPVTRDGNYTMVMFTDEYLGAYGLEGAKEEELDNVIVYFKQTVTAPARLAGEVLLVHETLNQAKENRKAWLYNPGQRRVRRAPNVAHDNPRTASDGLATSDQLDIFNGSPERYNWELVGRKEMLIPYNSYKLHSNKLKYDDILKPLHINQAHARYELHRVWVVDATVKEGTRHVYKRRTFYIDEDSWQAMVVDCYDNRDQIWRVQEAHSINYYDVPSFWTTLELTMDLQSGRYLAIGLNNEEPVTYDFSPNYTPEDFAPAILRRSGVR
ncbi:DUF1329 domain-containing protein [Thioalkalivibrio sp. XN8]|uniref:DUF1329 domain-containing protein n=1 Tax=Thioalkalivibrio sp. XN8 TaxID=2712863 RepID=UPI0013EC5120|nr:DUF1329 domain-containing protein [Thioalkalivibrio sp. XN8]NGP52656.1 DUF1329 domain-containing protein [Thioalkalivibrio sp. XN8]